ncbi:MAG: MFS transporter [Actinomycetota bacterium]|nr:MFS transporter [Actinomycetota bacterium]
MEAPAEPVGRARALHALRSRDFRLLWSGQTISLVGDGAFLVALGWKSFELTGSKSTLALVLMGHGTAMLATLLIGGALADRYPRRTLMIVSDLSRCAVMVALFAVDVTGSLDLWTLIALAVLYGAGDGFFYPAYGGIVPLVVDEHHLASANALTGLSRQGAFVVGPAVAGVLYGVAGASAVFALNGASFVVAAMLMWLARPRPFERDEPQGTLREIRDGLRYVMSVPWLWITIFLASFILMIAMAPYTALLPAFVEEQFDRGVGSYGTLFTLQSLGMAVGSLAFGQTNPTRRRVIIMYLLFAANDVCVISMALTHSFGLACLFVGLRGVCIGYGIGVWSTLLMQQVPSGKLARVTSLDFFGSFALIPVGYALTAAVAESFSPATLLLAGFGVSTVLWIVPLASKRVREAA